MIAIKDMEMPKNCLDCPISHEDKIDYYICGKTGKNVYLYANEIHLDCPLVEIVTCKDCKHWHDDGIMTTCDKNIGHGFPRDHFCADGKRRE